MLCLHSPIQHLHRPGRIMRRNEFVQARDVPERGEALLAAVRADGHQIAEAADHGLDPIAAIHTPEYLDFLRTAFDAAGGQEDVYATVFPVRHMGARYPVHVAGRAGWHMHDLMAPVGRHTWQAAVAAANLAADAAGRVLAGTRVVYALCRPSGHHAFTDMGGGSTYLNNAAIAAQVLRRGHDRVALIDIDTHHGNGTQGIFYDRADVFFASLHRDPVDAHPYFTGHAHETGAGAGEGYTLNLPLPATTDDAAYLSALETACARIAAFRPGALVVSLGFDAHEADPSDHMALTYDGFTRIGARLAALGLPTVLVQEGGYNVDGIGRCLSRFLAGFEAAL